MNLYMSYDHDTDDHVYFKVGLFPDGWLEDLLLLISEVDELSLLDLPALIPTFIDQGTDFRDLHGGVYTTEEDLYLALVMDLPLGDTVYNPLAWLESAVCDQPVVVYSRVPREDENFTWPSGYDPDTKSPNIESEPGWYVPEDIDTSVVIVASRKSTSPFWTHTSFDYWSAYPGEYNCEGLPYNVHVTCNPSELSTYLEASPYNEHAYQEVAGYYRAITSNASTWHGFDLDYIDSGSTQSLEGMAYRPQDDEDPAVWFYLPEEEPPSFGPVMPVVIQGLGLLVSLLGLENSPLGLFSLTDEVLLAYSGDRALVYISSREIWPFAADELPFAADELPFAA